MSKSSNATLETFTLTVTGLTSPRIRSLADALAKGIAKNPDDIKAETAALLADSLGELSIEADHPDPRERSTSRVQDFASGRYMQVTLQSEVK